MAPRLGLGLTGPFKAALAVVAVFAIGAAAASDAAATAASSPPSPQVSQSATASQLSIPDGKSVIGMLDSVINWYRGIQTETGIVQEPADVLFVSQDRTRADEIVKLAFQYARAEATALENLRGAPHEEHPGTPSGDLLSHPELILSRTAEAQKEVKDLQNQIQQLKKQIGESPRRRRAQLTDALNTAESQLQLAQARAEFLATMNQFESGEEVHHANAAGALMAQIDELERTIPPATNASQLAPAVVPAKTDGEPSGLIARGRAWLTLRSNVDLIAHRIQSTAQLGAQIKRARSGLVQDLRQIDVDARSLTTRSGIEAGASANPAAIEARKKDFQALLARHKLIGDALLPVTEMSLLLARYQSNLAGWSEQIQQRASAELYDFVLSAAGLAVVLALLVAIGLAWRRIAFRYVEDARRRSQMLQFRNVVVSILIAIVLAFEFVGEAGSLATVIGFGAAGIAVALQDVIISIAGYFRAGGRFGVKVGDWVELQGVRGEVIDIGLTKLTMMELAGEGAEREPTGRLVVMPNSVLFREKFANRAYGTSLGWDEVELSISPECDYRLAEKRLLEAVEEVFAHYRDAARSESREMERRYHVRMDSPKPQSRLKIGGDAIRLAIRYPVNVRNRAQIADEISRRLLDTLMREPSIKLVPSSSPALQPNAAPAVNVVDSPDKPEPQPARAPLRKA